MITLVPTATNKVWPSGLAAAAARSPIEPAAPPLLSITMVWPITGVMTCASSRALMSVLPPAA